MTGLGPPAGGLRLIRIVLVAVALGTVGNTVAGVYLFTENRVLATDNCESIHGIVVAGGNLIGTPKQIRARYARGEITRAQRDAALGWYAADCPKAKATPTP